MESIQNKQNQIFMNTKTLLVLQLELVIGIQCDKICPFDDKLNKLQNESKNTNNYTFDRQRTISEDYM